jgi:hypothetical protein
MLSCYGLKKFLLCALLFISALVIPITSMARVNIDINIALPPLVQFSAPPEVVAIPETDVYVDPELDVDIFFYNGWWWRPWQGRWYRSRDYRSDWVYYPRTPVFYNGLPSGWRHAYKEHRFKDRNWNYERISHDQLQHNWRDWKKDRHWYKQDSGEGNDRKYHGHKGHEKSDRD